SWPSTLGDRVINSRAGDIRSSLELTKLKEKVAIVTGGGTGIGKAICKALAAENAHVVVADIDVKSARQTCDELAGLGGRYIPMAADVRVESQVKQLVADTVQAL